MLLISGAEIQVLNMLKCLNAYIGLVKNGLSLNFQ